MPVDLLFRLYVIVDRRHHFSSLVCVRSLSRAKVSASFTNISRSNCTYVYCSVYCLSSRLSLFSTLVSSGHEVVIGLCATRIFKGFSIRSIAAIVSVVPLMYSL